MQCSTYSNADSKHCLQGLDSLKVLVRKLDETLQYRVEANLIAISQGNIIDLPFDHALTCGEVLADQAEILNKKTKALIER